VCLFFPYLLFLLLSMLSFMSEFFKGVRRVLWLKTFGNPDRKLLGGRNLGYMHRFMITQDDEIYSC
jgi:hypothetical protein